MNDPSKFRKVKVAHYFKQDFPDQRFLPLRQYLHNRTAKDALPDLGFFQRMYNEISTRKKKKSGISPERSNQIFTIKEKMYKDMFTTGDVDIRSDVRIEHEKNKNKGYLTEKESDRMSKLIRKAKLKSKNKNPLDMFVDPEKKRSISDRKFNKIVS